MKYVNLLFVSCLLGGMTGLNLQAELPPSAYESLKENAAVKATILVTKVATSLPPTAATLPLEKATQQPINIDVTARVISVERGKSKVETDGKIQISYSHEYRPPGFVGPGLVPVVLPGKVYEAYLDADAATPGLFVPAAGAQTFEPVEE